MRLKHQQQAAGKRVHGFERGRYLVGVVSKVIDHGDVIGFAHDLQSATDAAELAEMGRGRCQRHAARLRGTQALETENAQTLRGWELKNIFFLEAPVKFFWEAPKTPRAVGSSLSFATRAARIARATETAVEFETRALSVHPDLSPMETGDSRVRG